MALTQRPIFAILTMPDSEKGFRGNRTNFIDIIRTGASMGVDIFVITTDDLNPTQPIVSAYRYDSHKRRWFKEKIPLPQVIYNRIPFREDELQPRVKQLIRSCLKQPHLHLYNPYFFNKWDLFEWLRRSQITKRYIPSTHKWSPQLSLKKSLNRHRLLYLKPVKGKAGKGIMRISKVQNDKLPYRLTVQFDRQSQTMKYKDTLKLRSIVKQYIGDERYIVQQGIWLAEYEQRPFDIRVLVQKNVRGQWSITGVGARVAGNMSITTHVPRGGSIDSPHKLLNTAFDSETAKRIMARIRRTSLLIAKQIEKASKQYLGEMSMDLGIDKRGRIWFFEANSKPMKFDEADIRRKSLQRLIEYGLYLTNHPSAKRKKGR